MVLRAYFGLIQCSMITTANLKESYAVLDIELELVTLATVPFLRPPTSTSIYFIDKYILFNILYFVFLNQNISLQFLKDGLSLINNCI